MGGITQLSRMSATGTEPKSVEDHYVTVTVRNGFKNRAWIHQLANSTGFGYAKVFQLYLTVTCNLHITY